MRTHSFWKGFRKQAGITEVACVAVVNGDKILMGKRKDNGKWTTPGGHMDPGETPVQGAQRELFEEAGIKAEPADLEHLATKRVTKPDGTKLVVHGFKLDEGKHKTTIKGDPDEEVYRWMWKPIPLPAEVAENLHVQKGNVLLDALKIDYPQAQEKAAAEKVRIMCGDHYQYLLDKKKAEKKASQLMDLLPKRASFYNAVADHMSQTEATQPQAAPGEEKKDEPAKEMPHEKTEHSESPEESKTAGASMARRLARMKLRRGEIGNLGNQFAQFETQRMLDGKPHGEEL